jgi:hypothetical protein
MTNYAAEISTGTVNEIIVGNYVWANENLNGEWVDCTCGDQPCAGIGYAYNAETETFSPPPPPTPLDQ